MTAPVHGITSNANNLASTQSSLAAAKKLLTLPKHDTIHSDSNKQLTFSANGTTACGIGLVANSMKFSKLVNNKSNSISNTFNNLTKNCITKKQPIQADSSNLVLNKNSSDMLKAHPVLTKEDGPKSIDESILASSVSSVKEKIMLFTSVTNLSGCKNLACSKNNISNSSSSPSTALLNTHKPPSMANLEPKCKQRPLSQIITMDKNSSDSSALLKSNQLALSNQSIKSINASPTFLNTKKVSTSPKIVVNQSGSSVGLVTSKEAIETTSKNKNSLDYNSSNYSVTSSVLNNNNNNAPDVLDSTGSPSSIRRSNQSQLQEKNSFKSVKEKIAYFSSNLKNSPTSTVTTNKKVNRSIEIISSETQNAIQIKRNTPKDWDSLKYAYNSINNISDSSNKSSNKLNQYQLKKTWSTSSNVLTCKK